MSSPFEWTDARRALWARVETALDEGRDPLLDPALREELDADPALLEATSSLVLHLESIESSPMPPAELAGSDRSSASWPLALGILAAASLLLFTLQLSSSSKDGPDGDPPPSRAAAPSVTLVVERVLPSAPLGRTVTLTEESVQHWTLATHPE